MGELATEINAMCDRLARGEPPRRHGGCGTGRGARAAPAHGASGHVGQLAAGVAMELGTPLGVGLGPRELLASGDASSGDAEANGRIILEQTDRMTAIIQQLLDFSRPAGYEDRARQPGAGDTQTLDLIAPAAERANVTIECSPERPVFARVDTSQIQQVLANVFMNGIQAMPRGGRLRVTVVPAPPSAPRAGMHRRASTCA